MARRGRMSAANASRSASVVGSSTFEEQLPDVFERARLGEVDGAVLAVVVEALEAAHVADGRVGDDDAFEALRNLVRLCVGGLDHRDAHQVAHRHDADELRCPFRRPECAGSRARPGSRTRRAPRRRARWCRDQRSSTPRPSRSTRRSPRPRAGSCRVRSGCRSRGRRGRSPRRCRPCRSRMRVAAAATVSAGCAVTTGWLMTSRDGRSLEVCFAGHVAGVYDRSCGAETPWRPSPAANRATPRRVPLGTKGRHSVLIFRLERGRRAADPTARSSTARSSRMQILGKRGELTGELDRAAPARRPAR